MFPDQIRQFAFSIYRYALGIVGTGQLRRIFPALNIGNLRCRECNYFYLIVCPVKNIEIVKIAAGSTAYYYLLTFHKIEIINE